VKAYKRFIFAFVVVLALYIAAELNKPKPIDWTVTLSKEDKNPYGSYVFFQLLKDLFPAASIQSFRLPVYDQINNYSDSNTAYLLIDPQLKFSKEDIDEMLNYVVTGNYVFISSFEVSKRISDSLHVEANRRFTFKDKDSVRINFVNPALHAANDYRFNRLTIDEYFEKFDTSHSVVLGTNQFKDANFIKMPYGNGAFFLHANPLCFSNYFMLTRNNAAYTSTALSFIPADVKKIYWDEYYKSGPTGPQTPLRFILSNIYLRWAYRIALIAMLVFVFFEMKRRQRIIPVIPPLRNSTLDFVQTVGGVYFNQHDNRNIAAKKIQYLMDYIRSHFYLQTTNLDEEFVQSLIKKSGIDEEEIKSLINDINYVINNGYVSDDILLQINKSIESFYKKAK
jgi:uncharacterized protein DUF4350